MQLPDHLAWNSPCKDMGNPLFTTNDVGPDDIDGEERIFNSRIDIGADEVYSCNPPLSEDDIYNPMDGNADGLLNFEEFSRFSRAWLSRSPFEFGDPNLTDPNNVVNWDAACNLVDTGDSAYCIDLADLVEFMDNGYWLWTACWKAGMEIEMVMMSGGEGMLMMEPLSMELMEIQAVESNPETSLNTLVQIVGFLDEIIAEDPDNVENIRQMRAVLMDEIRAIWNRQNE